MANKFTRFLTGVANGLTNGGRGLPSTYAHATRLFLDDSYRLAPRTKFNYYVNFEIDPDAKKAISFSQRDAQDVGFLVKTTDLPSFQFDLVTKNQYNRKKKFYKMINYDPLTIRFHDDSHGIINALWALYYGYYVVDRSLPNTAYDATKYTKNSDLFYRYGLDNKISVPFLRKINIYTMARKRWLGYSLVNPIITRWQHGEMDYANSSEFAENTMTVEYESVQYSGGTVQEGNPKGFATLYYDNRQSALGVAGGGAAALFGSGGVLDGASQVFGSVSDGSAFDSPENFAGTALAAINTMQNAGSLNATTIGAELLGKALSDPQSLQETGERIGGAINAAFPGIAEAQEGAAIEKKITDVDQSGRVRGGL